ncbi:MAG: hypothetical protein Q4P20_02910 [Eubacteriales bacterium]|nr:hypothetical protein [Eubacteriales bacterium]
MTMLLPAMLRTLELSAEIKAELYPILLFLGMFFVVFGMGGILVRHLPRKPGSMLDEILSEKWEDEEETDEPEDETELPGSDVPPDTAEAPEAEDTIGK